MTEPASVGDGGTGAARRVTTGVPEGVHEIEAASYDILGGRVDLTGWPDGSRDVVARVVHATASPELAGQLVVPPSAVAAGMAALRSGSVVVCDVEMVRAGIDRRLDARCYLGEAGWEAGGGEAGGGEAGGGEAGGGDGGGDGRGRRDGPAAGDGAAPTRSALAMRLAAARHPDGAVFVVGCAPTALEELCGLVAARRVRPALVIGTPVGFVGAAESAAHLRAVADATGTPAITIVGERGGSPVAAAAANAIARLALGVAPGAARAPALFLIGHGTRSAAGVAQFGAFVEAARAMRSGVPVGHGLIELAEPDLDAGIDALVGRGVGHVVAVPVVLLGAGHLKDDGPVALDRARRRHPGVRFTYGRDLGVHPDVLAVADDRIRAADGAAADAVVVVGRGSTDPDANADLAKAARLLADRRGLGTGGRPGGAGGEAGTLGMVEPAFVSLAPPEVAEALDRVHRLGARRITVAPYFLFTGVLPERLTHQATAWAADHPGTQVSVAEELGVDDRLVALAWHRYDEALGAGAVMNCDGCIYRSPVPGYEERVGQAPLAR